MNKTRVFNDTRPRDYAVQEIAHRASRLEEEKRQMTALLEEADCHVQVSCHVASHGLDPSCHVPYGTHHASHISLLVDFVVCARGFCGCDDHVSHWMPNCRGSRNVSTSVALRRSAGSRTASWTKHAVVSTSWNRYGLDVKVVPLWRRLGLEPTRCHVHLEMYGFGNRDGPASVGSHSTNRSASTVPMLVGHVGKFRLGFCKSGSSMQ